METFPWTRFDIVCAIWSFKISVLTMHENYRLFVFRKICILFNITSELGIKFELMYSGRSS